MRTQYRNILSILLIICLLFSIMPTAAFAAEAESQRITPIAGGPQEENITIAPEELTGIETTAPVSTPTPPENSTNTDQTVSQPSETENSNFSLQDDPVGDEPTSTTDVSGKIVWVNRNQQNSSARPTSVTLTLYANGTATDHIITVTAPSSSSTTWPFTFSGVPATDENGAINYTVVESTVSGYETTYSTDTLTITNSYIGGVPANHTFKHIDVRIAGASLELQYVIKDSNGVVISRNSKTIEAYVTKIESVTINGTTYTGFTKSGNYEFRKTSGVSISSSSLNSNSTATLVVDLRDSEGKTYDNVSITYGLGGIMDAAYQCDGARNGRFDGLDFVVGAAQNYNIDICAYGLQIDVQKYIKVGDQNATAFSGSGNEFSFLLTEYENGAATGRTWTIRNNAAGAGSAMVTYLYNDLAGLENYKNRTFTYTLSEVAGAASEYQYDTTVYTFTVGFTISKTENADGGYTENLIPAIKEEAYASGDFTFTNVLETTTVSGSKTWNDNNNQDGARPKSITINLLKNGNIIDSKVVTAQDGWAWSFTGLAKYNSDGSLINYSITENTVTDYSTTYNGYNVTNTHTPEKVSITVTKTWNDSNNQDGIRPNEIIVKLFANEKDTGKTLTLNSGNNWTGSFTQLDKYSAGQQIDYSIDEVSVNGYTTQISGTPKDGFIITNSHTPETTEVSGSKTWDDNNNQDGARPESITVNLVKNGKVIDSKVVTEKDGWAWSFTGLPKYENGGSTINYSVTENAVADYSTSYNGYDIINTHTPEKTSVTVSKAWEDHNNQDGIRPNDITVKLLANEKDTGLTLVLSDGNNWTGSFTELDKYSGGEAIAYTVEEVNVDEYSSVITGSADNGYIITNSHTPTVVEISGSKTWDDNNNQDGVRPESITINLLKNGKVIDSKVVTEKDGWAWSFTNLPKYENEGTEIVYSVTETPVDNYSASYDGYNVVNTHTPEQTSINVSKAWEDNDDQDGIRPDSITVKLFADGKDTGKTLVLDAKNNWTGSFTGLDKSANSKTIVYTVEEVQVDGYSAVVTGTQEDGFLITNSHSPELTQISGSKTWDDNNNKDGVRPESITIRLLKNGKEIESRVITEKDGWAWNFTDLPKYESSGAEIQYTITEDAVTGYTTTYDGYNVINSYNPEEISITVTKSWVDSNNADKTRPDRITVKLYADGVDTGKTLVLSQDSNWSGSFTGLSKYNDGKLMKYTIEEVAVQGYNTVIKGNVENGFVITNSHTSIPQTGDNRTPMLWFTLMFLSGAAIVGTGYSLKKRKRTAK